MDNLSPVQPQTSSGLKTYLIWIAIILILFLILAYFFPILPCKAKTVKTSLSCTPEQAHQGQCVYQESQEVWKFCSLKSAIADTQDSSLEIK